MKSSNQLNRRSLVHRLFDLIDRGKWNSLGDLLEEYEQIREPNESLRAIEWLISHMLSLVVYRTGDRVQSIIERHRNGAKVTAARLCKLSVNIEFTLRTSRNLKVAGAFSLVLMALAITISYVYSNRRQSPLLAENAIKSLHTNPNNLRAQIVVLTPTMMLRSESEALSRIELDPATEVIRFQLHAPEQDLSATYQIKLRRVFDLAEFLIIQNPTRINVNTFEVILPAHFLLKGDYILSLSAENGDPIFDYAFRILPRMTTANATADRD